MIKSKHMAVLGLIAAVAIVSGCASKPHTTRQINSLQAQVGVLTDELIRLDEQLQAIRGSIQQDQNAGTLGGVTPIAGGPSSAIRGIYRTPSGFELPAVSIQQALKNAGYYQGPLDGKIGPDTREAVRSFQRDNGLKADGVVGRNTWKSLKVYATVVK